MIKAAERIAAGASPARLALCLAAVLAAFLVNALAHGPIEQALRPTACSVLECLRPLRPEAQHGGVTAAAYRDFFAATAGLRARALLALLTDLPLIAAITVALLTAAGLARRGLPIAERSQRLLVVLPLAFAAADLVEDTLLALAYAGLADTASLLPWITALKFGTLVASALLSALLGFARWVL